MSDTKLQSAADRVRILASIIKPKRKTRILDVGAKPFADGRTQYTVLRLAEVCKVWSFEPQQEEFERLQKLQGHDQNEYILPYALGDGQKQELKICLSSWFTSLLEPNEDFWKLTGQWRRALRVVDRVPVQTRRLDDIHECPQFDMIKIDVQGAENEIFKNGETKLSNTLVVMTEVSALEMYLGQGLLDEQMATLRRLGFSLHKFMHLKQIVVANSRWASRLRPLHRSQIADGDGIFIRALMNLQSFDSEQLKHLALICDGCLESYDLTLTILEILTQRGVVDASALNKYVDMIPNILD